MMNCRWVLSGALGFLLVQVQAQEIEMDMAVVGTDKGSVQSVLKDRDDLNRLLILERRLVSQLLVEMGIDPALLVRRKPLHKFSLRGLEILGEALEAMDLGKFSKARLLLKQLDPAELKQVSSLLEQLPGFDVDEATDREVTDQIAIQSTPSAKDYADELASSPDWKLLGDAGQKTGPFPVDLERLVLPDDFSTGDQAQSDELYKEDVPVIPPEPPAPPVQPPQDVVQ